MPELPEVETIKRQLRDRIVGKEIIDIEVRKQRLFQGKVSDVVDVKIVDVRRRAKMLVIDLKKKNNIVRARRSDYRQDRELLHRTSSESKDSMHLLFHLKMSGQVIYRNKDGKFGGGHPIPKFDTQFPGKMTHVIFTLDDKSHIYFNEQRQFGWVKVLDDVGLKKEFSKYGIEPLSDKFTYIKFKKLLLKRKRSKIKPVLMDQKLIAGIGNIYASEVCFLAGVNPDRIVGSLKNEEFKKVYNSIRKILPIAIKYQGTSMDLYVNASGEQGKYEKYLQVYGRAGEKCLRCGGIIKKIKQSGRGTYYCPACQS
jgi:formamidopyrimidine-DNA glycosylase